MGVVNRTDEFRQILRDFATKSGGGLNFETPQATSQLNRWSSEISAEIHETLQKVGELRKLSKQTRLFNAKTDQIQELIYTVTQKIQLLNPKIEALESQVKSSRKNKSYQTHASTLVETLKTRFFQLNKEFKDAQEDWTKALLQQEQRRQDLMYSSAPRHVDPVPRWQRPRPTGDSEDLEVGGARAVAMQHGYRSSRVEAVRGVQKNISELAQIVQRIAVTVTAQEETVRRIDDELDDAVVNLQLGQANLLQYFRAISSNRALIVKVFLILIFFVIFFVVFLA